MDSAELIILSTMIILTIVTMAGIWKVFSKAGEPGWGILIPIYQTYLFIKVAGRPGWWTILAFIPIVSLITLIIPFDIAQRFGRGTGFGLGLLFLPFIFFPILGFGDSEYDWASA